MQHTLTTITAIGDPIAGTFYAEAGEAEALLLFVSRYGTNFDILVGTSDTLGDAARLIPKKILTSKQIKKFIDQLRPEPYQQLKFEESETGENASEDTSGK